MQLEIVNENTNSTGELTEENKSVKLNSRQESDQNSARCIQYEVSNNSLFCLHKCLR